MATPPGGSTDRWHHLGVAPKTDSNTTKLQQKPVAIPPGGSKDFWHYLRGVAKIAVTTAAGILLTEVGQQGSTPVHACRRDTQVKMEMSAAQDKGSDAEHMVL
eukprot:scaffold30180_cov19-Tisochrysis_lutea.AAC.2